MISYEQIYHVATPVLYEELRKAIAKYDEAHAQHVAAYGSHYTILNEGNRKDYLKSVRRANMAWGKRQAIMTEIIRRKNALRVGGCKDDLEEKKRIVEQKQAEYEQAKFDYFAAEDAMRKCDHFIAKELYRIQEEKSWFEWEGEMCKNEDLL